MTARSTQVTIWKFHLALIDEQVIEMPTGAIVLHAGAQGEQLFLWATVCPDHLREPRRFRIIGTGHPIDDFPGKHIGSVVMDPFVWHVFERTP